MLHPPRATRVAAECSGPADMMGERESILPFADPATATASLNEATQSFDSLRHRGGKRVRDQVGWHSQAPPR